MLSTIAEARAENHSKPMLARPASPPVAWTRTSAIAPMMPTWTTASTSTNRPTKNMSVDHPTARRLTLLGRHLEMAPEHERDDTQVRGEHNQRDRRQVHQEITEAETRRRADQDVWWVTDERRRATDVGGQDRSNQVGHGRDAQSARYGKRDRRGQNDGCDVVEKS